MIHVMYWYHVIPLQNAKTPIPGNIGINVLSDVDGLNKKIFALVKGKQLEGMKLSKLSGQGDQRYLNYYGFFQTSMNW